jgi:ribosomal protein L14
VRKSLGEVIMKKVFIVMYVILCVSFIGFIAEGSAFETVSKSSKEVNLRPGQKMHLKDGSYLVLKRNRLVLVQERMFPAGAKIVQNRTGRISIIGENGKMVWGSGSTD